MACTIREETGSCGHPQCKFPEETPHGFNCVDILWDRDKRGFCELGFNCLSHCPFSHKKEDRTRVLKLVNEFYPVGEIGKTAWLPAEGLYPSSIGFPDE